MKIILDMEWMGNPKGKHLDLNTKQALLMIDRGTAHVDPEEKSYSEEIKKGGLKIVFDEEWLGDPKGTELCIVEWQARKMIERGVAHEVSEKKQKKVTKKKSTKKKGAKKMTKKKSAKTKPSVSGIKRRGLEFPKKDKMVAGSKNK
jgi:hypothetical protein